MAAESAELTNLPEWDLSDLYGSPDDPTLSTALPALKEDAAQFESRWKGRISGGELSPAELRQALDEYEAILRRSALPQTYAGLRFSQDTSDPQRGAQMQRLQVEATEVHTRLLFFTLELGQLSNDAAEQYLAAPELADYRHFLDRQRVWAPHNLTEPEEKMTEELSNTGSRAFMRLFSEVTSRARFKVRSPEGEQELTASQVLSLLYEPDRNVRVAACDAVTATVKDLAHVCTFIYNNTLQEKSTHDRLRRYPEPESYRHLSNDLSAEPVDCMTERVAANYDIVADYYRLKRDLLNLPKLTHADRYAPLLESSQKIAYEDASRLVLQAFGDFSPEMRALTEPFFDNGWIDAALHPGKRGGAFCSSVTPDRHPYVFMNYTGRTRDVMTLAHELGHGVHGMLARRNNYLQFHSSLALAETASVFAEMLVFERLQQEITDPRERLAMLCGKIEDTFATVFRQVSMYRFEQAAHRARRTEGELTTERYNAIWQDSMQAMFGDSLTLGGDHAWWWLTIPHVYQSPFYVYAYAFGELLVFALYSRYRAEGESFIPRYFELLALGGSRMPEEALADLGIDIRDPAFWQGGLDLIRGMVTEARTLADRLEIA